MVVFVVGLDLVAAVGMFELAARVVLIELIELLVLVEGSVGLVGSMVLFLVESVGALSEQVVIGEILIYLEQVLLIPDPGCLVLLRLRTMWAWPLKRSQCLYPRWPVVWITAL